MNLPGFDFDKYEKIRGNTPTIISPNCWAGMLYNRLGLPFKTPLINMFEDHKDYLKLLSDLDSYMNVPLKFEEVKYDSVQDRNYPVARCADILLHFNHYDTFDDANACWERRKKRLDIANSLVMIFDETPEIIDEFLKLPYKNKICFVPFESPIANVCSLCYTGLSDVPFWKMVSEGANGFIYDVFELLLNNKILKFTELQ